MKQFFTLLILCFFTCITNSWGYSIEKIKSDGSSQALEAPERASSEDLENQKTKKLTEVGEINDDVEIESDSSYYSVNKFNILFYFVYKLKYGEEEDSSIEE